MKRFIILCIFANIVSGANSQQLSLLWAKQYGGPNAQRSQAISTDVFGNIITAGYFQGFADFNPGSGSEVLSSNGQKDAYVGKLDNNGNYLWAVSFGGTGDDQVFDIATDNFGNVIVVGTFTSSSFDADPGPNTVNLATTSYLAASFVIKFDADGNYLWSAAYTSPLAQSYVAMKAVDTDQNGNVIIGGTMNLVQFDAVDFNFGSGTNELGYLNKYFFLTLTPAGTFANILGLEGSYNFVPNMSDMELDSESNIYFSGDFFYTIDFDPSAGTYNISNSGYYLSFVCKLSQAGELQWVAPVSDDNSSVTSTGLELDESGNVYHTGKFESTVDFNPELLGVNELMNSSGYAYGYLLKLNNLGEFVYAKVMSTGTPSVCNDITHDSDGNLFIIGAFSGTSDFNPSDDLTENRTSVGSSDVYITKLNAEGAFQNTHVFGSTFPDEGTGIIFPSQSDGYVAAGSFSETIDMDPSSNVFNLISGGETDAFILEYTECQPAATSFDAIGCGSYQWNDQAYTIAGSYQQTFFTANGCDSLVTMNLTIASSSTSSLTIDACDQYVFNEDELTESGDYIATYTNSQGCDSLVYLNLTITTSPSLALNIDGNLITATSTSTTYQWYNCETGNNIEGATGASYSPTQSGTYGVYVTDSPCTINECTEFTYIGIEESNRNSIVIYPNPADEHIILNSKVSCANSVLSIFNSTGMRVMENTLRGSSEKLDVLDLAAGVYTIQIVCNGEVVQEKFVKK